MKNTFRILALSMIMSFGIAEVEAQAYQPFPTECATWDVIRCWIFYQPGWYDKYKFVMDGSDTLYDGNEYKKISIIQHHAPGTAFDSLHAPVFFGGLREANKQIFIFQIWASVDTSAFMVYDFNNTDVGDTIYTNVLSGNTNLFGHIVLSTDSVLIGANYHKRLHLQDTGNISNVEDWIEGVGSSMGLPFATFWSITDNSYDLTCYNTIDSARYENPSPSLGFCTAPLPNVTCDTISICDTVEIEDTTTTFISLQVFNGNLFELYPNPANDVVTLKTNDSGDGDLLLTIYDARGSVVKQKKLIHNKTQIAVNDLNNGIYMLVVKSDHGLESKRLVIRR
jgi:hypothetical protein